MHAFKIKPQLRAYSHAAFALGVAYDTRPPQCMETVGMFVNTVLVPFRAAAEPIEEVQRRWVRQRPHSHLKCGPEARTFQHLHLGLREPSGRATPGTGTGSPEDLLHLGSTMQRRIRRFDGPEVGQEPSLPNHHPLSAGPARHTRAHLPAYAPGLHVRPVGLGAGL